MTKFAVMRLLDWAQGADNQSQAYMAEKLSKIEDIITIDIIDLLIEEIAYKK